MFTTINSFNYIQICKYRDILESQIFKVHLLLIEPLFLHLAVVGSQPQTLPHQYTMNNLVNAM